MSNIFGKTKKELYSTQGFEVNEKNFMFAKLIGDAPTDKVLREIFQNTLENPNTSRVISGEIKVDGFLSKKFFMLNDGKGITNMVKLASLFGSEKNLNNDLRGNNNTGVRLMGSAANKLGIAFITKLDDMIGGILIDRPYKDNRVFEPVVHTMLEKENNIYGLVKDYGKQYGINGDWTMVICLGETSEQNTFKQPDYKSDLISNTYVADFIKNRYYSRPTTMMEGVYPIDLKIANNDLTFIDEELKKVDGIDFTFETNLAKYVVKYSDKFGKVIPKSAIVVENELFDVRADSYSFGNIVKNSINFMRDIGAYNIKDKLSIIAFPKNSLEIRMDNYRERLIAPKTAHFIGSSNFTLRALTQDFIDNSPKKLRELIENSNDQINAEPSDELKESLLKSLGNRYNDFDGIKIKSKRDSDKRKIENNIKDSLKFKNPFVEDLLNRYPLIEYNIEDEAINLNKSIDELKLIIKKYSKDVRKKMKLILIYLNETNNKGIKDTSLELVKLSHDINAISLKNLFVGLNIEDRLSTPLIEAYSIVSKIFIKELVKVITKDGVDGNQGKKQKKDIRPLSVQFRTNLEWNKDHKNIDNKDLTFALYNKFVLEINSDNEEFREILNYIDHVCKSNNIPSDIGLESLKAILGLYGGYLNNFKIITESENLNLNEDERVEYQFKQSGEIFYSHVPRIKDIIKDEMNLKFKQNNAYVG